MTPSKSKMPSRFMRHAISSVVPTLFHPRWELPTTHVLRVSVSTRSRTIASGADRARHDRVGAAQAIVGCPCHVLIGAHQDQRGAVALAAAGPCILDDLE